MWQQPHQRLAAGMLQRWSEWLCAHQCSVGRVLVLGGGGLWWIHTGSTMAQYRNKLHAKLCSLLSSVMLVSAAFALTPGGQSACSQAADSHSLGSKNPVVPATHV